MGAPKQKWTSEEEAALKAGIHKYGAGKWSTILKDPEFSSVLRSRSNVDLKDKWRNLNCMANGSGSRSRSRVLIKSNQCTSKPDEDNTGCSTVEKESEVLVVTSSVASNEVPQEASSKRQILRMDDSILEAITKLKEPRGSSRLGISQYIEEHYSIPPDFERTLVANLKILTENGRLIKVKHQYRIAPKSHSYTIAKEPPMSLENGFKKEADKNGIVLLTKAKIDAELEKMKSMNAEEAAAAAARAVAEAEAALAEAEAAAREAEEAEAEAEAAQCFADAAQKALQYQTISV